MAVDSFLKNYFYNIELVEVTERQAIVKKWANSCKKVNYYACTPLGDHFYLWNKKLFYNTRTKQKIKLSNQQNKKLTQIIKNHLPAKDGKQLEQKLLASKEYSAFFKSMTKI